MNQQCTEAKPEKARPVYWHKSILIKQEPAGIVFLSTVGPCHVVGTQGLARYIAPPTAYPVMLVPRTSDGKTRWMNISVYLERKGKETRQIEFEREPFTAENLREKVRIGH